MLYSNGMYWLLAVALEVVLETIISIRYRKTAKHSPANAALSTFVMYGLGVAPVGIIFALFFKANPFELTLPALLWTVVASVLFATANILIYKTYAKIDSSLYVIINSSKYAVVIGVAYWFLGDSLTLQQLSGVLLILVASLGVSWLSRGNKQQAVALKYIVLAFVASITVGLAQVSERVAVVASSMGVYILIGWALQALILAVIARPTTKNIKALSKKGLTKNLIITGLFRGAAGLCLVYAVSVTQNVALVSAIAATRVVSVAVASYFILRERTMPVARFGAAIATVLGIVLIVT